MSSWSYSKAGVDLDKHKAMHRFALEAIENLNRELGFDIESFGGYAATIKYNNILFSLHVDGVGTKTIVLQKLNKLYVAGWDCIAMNVNDIACDGIKPLAVVDYIAMSKPDENSFREIMKGIIDAAKVARVALLGGETAILPDLVNGFDVVCTALGVKNNSFANRAQTGDVVIGVSSWGLHANGYSLVRKVLESSGVGYTTTIDGINIAEEITKPVAIYSNLILELIEQNLITSAAHITGGAFSKLKRVLPQNLDMILKMPTPPKIFEVIMKLGSISIEEMYKVFNMGIGLVITTSREKSNIVKHIIEKHGFKPYDLGDVVSGSGKIILETAYGTIVTF